MFLALFRIPGPRAENVPAVLPFGRRFHINQFSRGEEERGATTGEQHDQTARDQGGSPVRRHLGRGERNTEDGRRENRKPANRWKHRDAKPQGLSHAPPGAPGISPGRKSSRQAAPRDGFSLAFCRVFPGEGRRALGPERDPRICQPGR